MSTRVVRLVVFQCTALRARLTVEGCATNYKRSNSRRAFVPGKARPDPIAACVRCPIGKAHSKGEESPVESAELTAALEPMASKPKGPKPRAAWARLASWSR